MSNARLADITEYELPYVANQHIPVSNDLALDTASGASGSLAIAVSPALNAGGRGAVSAFEVKFLLSETVAQQVEQRLSKSIQLDTYADPNLQNAYRVHTIFCDTPEFDVFYQVGSYRRRKYRVRRYGNEQCVYLERKTKERDRVRKLRTKIGLDELPLLTAPLADPNWCARWFHDQLLTRRLRPVCSVQYLRTAYVGHDDTGPLRLTFDRQVRGALADGWTLPESFVGQDAFTDRVIVEFKFLGVIPVLFKSVISDLSLESVGNSKYRHCFRQIKKFGERSESHA
jgi:hypothetical protein